MSYSRSDSCCCLRCKILCCNGTDKSDDSQRDQYKTHFHNIWLILICNSHINNCRHYQRNKQLKRCFQHLEQRSKYGFFFIIFKGKLQTELALLRYRLPRLQGMGEALSRQGGGGGGGGGARRGAGETKLELDRRHVHARIDALAEKLAEMEKRRGESRKARAKTGMPVVSLVGYTNVGKSSLMNALCGPSVAEADMLFATLDPTSRKLVLPSGMAVLLVDTVGFVSRLPHNLVEAFKSTLEEAAWSDVIVRVADAGDEQREEQLSVTDEVLDGLDCADIPRLTVYNKCDKPNTLSFDPDTLLTSAKTGYGLDKLLQKLDEVLSDRVHTIRVLLPYDKLGLAAPMRERGSVQAEEYREDGLYLEGIVKTEDLHCFEGYLV